MRNTYIPIYELKTEARLKMRGNLLNLIYACIMPVIIITALTALILNILPGASESIRLVMRGSFASPEEQQSYLLGVLDMMSNSFQLVRALLFFLRIGGILMILSVLRGKKASCKALFAYFPRWFAAAAYSLIVFAAGFVLTFIEDKASGTAGEWISFVCMLASLFISLKLSFAPYILADTGCKNPIYAIAQSWKMANLKIMCNIIVLCVSFIGWMLVCVFTMGIAFLFVIPYMETTLAALYERVRIG